MNIEQEDNSSQKSPDGGGFVVDVGEVATGEAIQGPPSELDKEQRAIVEALIGGGNVEHTIQSIAEAERRGIKELTLQLPDSVVISPEDRIKLSSLIFGVRIDDCGVLDPSVVIATSDLAEAHQSGDKTAIEHAKKELDSITNLPESLQSGQYGQLIHSVEVSSELVGTFCGNNGVIQYVNQRGEVFVAPANALLMAALDAAGYRQQETHVNCSNGEYPADEDAARTLLEARARSRFFGAVQSLIDRIQNSEIDQKHYQSIAEAIKTELGSEPKNAHFYREVLINIHQALYQIREGSLRDELDTPRQEAVKPGIKAPVYEGGVMDVVTGDPA